MISTQYPNDFWHKRKIDNFDPYNVFLAIATNIPQRLKSGFVLQGHIYVYQKNKNARTFLSYISVRTIWSYTRKTHYSPDVKNKSVYFSEPLGSE